VNFASFTLDHPAFANRTGRGVSVAVIDSGVHTANPHITAVSSGVHISGAGQDHDVIDRLGHGTAVAAAILEKAPAIVLVPVRVFERTLATSATVLARAIDWSVSANCRLINLSLGTTNPEREKELKDAVHRAREAGAIVVSARELAGVHWLPGSIPGVAGVLLDPDCARDELRVATDSKGEPVFRASGYPRPIPGVSADRNLSGISFAVANTTGFFARLLEAYPQLRTPHDLIDVLVSTDRC
jgi:hypothetical protein